MQVHASASAEKRCKAVGLKIYTADFDQSKIHVLTQMFDMVVPEFDACRGGRKMAKQGKVSKCQI